MLDNVSERSDGVMEKTVGQAVPSFEFERNFGFETRSFHPLEWCSLGSGNAQDNRIGLTINPASVISFPLGPLKNPRRQNCE